MRSVYLPWFIALVIVTSGVLYLALTPVPPSDGAGWDKANHVLAMVLVTVVAFSAFRPAVRAILFAGLFGIILGGLIEVLQGLCTTTRSAEWGDFAADAVGVAVAMLGIMLWQKRKAVS